MKKLRSIEIDILINSSKEELWDLTFNRFGEVNNFNPLIEGSHFTTESKGEVGCERHCSMDSKGTHVVERIIDATGHDTFEIEIIGGNMPMMDTAFARFYFDELGPNKTNVRLVMRFRSKPAFMGPLMSMMMKRMMPDMLRGMKYHAETGELVTKENIKAIKKAYVRLGEGEAFSGLGLRAA